MLVISLLTNDGGSYRTIQRFFATLIAWLNILCLFFRHHTYNRDEIYLSADDESIVTKSGSQTHGLNQVFSTLYGKPVLGITFFAMSLVAVKECRSYPVSIQQVVRTEEEKASAKARTNTRKKKKKKVKTLAPGHLNESKNKDKSLFCPTPELSRINSMIEALLRLISSFLPLTYLVIDGHFGHNQALLMAKKNGLLIISKLHHNAALCEKFDETYSGKGRHRIYGAKLDCKNLPAKYLKKIRTESGVVTRYYQAEFLYRDFAQPLNVVWSLSK